MALRGSPASTADSSEKAEAPMNARQPARKVCQDVTHSDDVLSLLLQNFRPTRMASNVSIHLLGLKYA